MIIMPKTADEIAAEEAREKAEMTWCDPDAPEEERTEHDKKMTGMVSDSYPGLHHWICSLCSFHGHDRVY